MLLSLIQKIIFYYISKTNVNQLANMKKSHILLAFFILLNLATYAQEPPAEETKKTIVGKGLKEIDKIATKSWEDIKKFFKSKKGLAFPYKIGKNKHERKIKKHVAPANYITTNSIIQTTHEEFNNISTLPGLEPELDIKVMYPRINPNKGYVSFQVGDFRYKRYLSGITTDNIEYIKLKLPDSLAAECEVQKFRILPKQDVKRHFSFVLDHSGSMGDYRASKLQQGVYNAIQSNFKRDKDQNDTYSIHKFDGEGNIQHLITSSNLQAIKNVLLPTNGLSGFGRSTAIKDALLQAVENLAKDKKSDSKIVVLFTDGVTNTDMSPLQLSDVIRLAIDNKINIAPVGFGSYVDANLLRQITYYAGGRFYRIYNEDEFNQLFENIILDAEMNYEIEFSPCIFGDDIQIELKLKGLEKPLIGSTFFSTPAKEGYSIDINILFKKGSATVDENLYSAELKQITTLLNHRTDINILIEGHTDKVGTENSNINLSKKRAESVKNYLISQGISEIRIKTKGYGWSSPAYPYKSNQNENDLNRRIEIKIVNQ